MEFITKEDLNALKQTVLKSYVSDDDHGLHHHDFLRYVADRILSDLPEPETNDERYQREARTPGTQAWAETRGDDLGESPDY